jgi:rhodanese-related sulfurtransferase
MGTKAMHLRTFISMMACSASLLIWHGSALATLPSVTLEAAREALEKSNAIVVDIREPGEHANGVAKGALLIPMAQFARRFSELPKSATSPVLVMCNTQNRSSRIVEQLIAAGYTNASYVQGGMSQWAARGWPLVKPQ